MARDFSKMFVKPRARGLAIMCLSVDRGRQLQHFAVPEDSYNERISRFEGGDAVVDLLVVFVAG